MQIRTRSRITVFFLALIIWLALTSFLDVQEIVAGIVVALLVSLAAGQFLFTSTAQPGVPRRLVAAVRYFLKFLWEMIKANFHVAYIVVHPLVPIKPGIIKVTTTLSRDTALTVLANSITLTPGTLTIDVDTRTHALYIHWIDVAATDIRPATEMIGSRFEHLLKEVFE